MRLAFRLETVLKRDSERLISNRQLLEELEETHRNRMATQEQVQEALRRLQSQEARVAALENAVAHGSRLGLIQLNKKRARRFTLWRSDATGSRRC